MLRAEETDWYFESGNSIVPKHQGLKIKTPLQICLLDFVPFGTEMENKAALKENTGRGAENKPLKMVSGR